MQRSKSLKKKGNKLEYKKISELHEEYLKQMDDEQLLGLIRKEMEKCEIERKKLNQQREKYNRELTRLQTKGKNPLLFNSLGSMNQNFEKKKPGYS